MKKIKPKEKIENWRKRFDKLTNAIKFEENLKGKNIVTNEDVEIVDSDFLAKEFRGILRHYFKPFILELLKFEKKELLTLTLERIKNILKEYETKSGKKEGIYTDIYAKLSEEISRED